MAPCPYRLKGTCLPLIACIPRHTACGSSDVSGGPASGRAGPAMICKGCRRWQADMLGAPAVVDVATICGAEMGPRTPT